MDISYFLKYFVLSTEIVLLLLGVSLSAPEIRYLEPEFEPTPRRVTHKKGDRATLFCSVRNLGELTVTWRRISETTPITIGTLTWIPDPRISVEHAEGSTQWDLIIDGVAAADGGEYECQVSTRDKMLRHRVMLSIPDASSGQMKRNPDIMITGSQFLSRGADINLMCNASVTARPDPGLMWMKEAHEVMPDSRRVFLSYVKSPDKYEKRDHLSSNLQIRNARADDSGVYTCKSRDDKLITSAQVNVMTGGSNNVKRAGVTTMPSSESSAVDSVQCAISHVPFILATLLTTRLFS